MSHAHAAMVIQKWARGMLVRSSAVVKPTKLSVLSDVLGAEGLQVDVRRCRYKLSFEQISAAEREEFDQQLRQNFSANRKGKMDQFDGHFFKVDASAFSTLRASAFSPLRASGLGARSSELGLATERRVSRNIPEDVILGVRRICHNDVVGWDPALRHHCIEVFALVVDIHEPQLL